MSLLVKRTIACPTCGRPGCLVKTDRDLDVGLVIHEAKRAAGGKALARVCQVRAWPAKLPIYGRDE